MRSKKWTFAPYFSDVKARIARQWMPPHDPADTATRSTVLAIEIFDDGSLGGVTVQRSSGVQALDDEAVRSVKAAAPFDPPPPALRPMTFSLELLAGPTATSPRVVPSSSAGAPRAP